MSRVSVVVPVYNAGNKLEKCIKSILNQTFTDFELILVNDGSTDSSLELCNKFHKQDKRVKVINKTNEGSILTRKKGLQSSNSDYVMFVDADDWIDKEIIETLYKEAISNDLDIAICNMYRVLGSGRIIRRKVESWYFNKDKIYNQEEIKQDLITAYFNGHPFPSSLCAKLYKRELLLNEGRYLEKIKFLGDDLFYNIEILLKTKNLKMIDKPLYYYRIGGFTSKYQPYLFDDMVNGYLALKDVIDKHYQDTKQTYNGISIMLLNTFKTCLLNLFNSKHKKIEIKDYIARYVSNEFVLECVSNEGSKKYFPKEYLEAIENTNIDYLYFLGESAYKKNTVKRAVSALTSKISII